MAARQVALPLLADPAPRRQLALLQHKSLLLGLQVSPVLPLLLCYRIRRSGLCNRHAFGTRLSISGMVNELIDTLLFSFTLPSQISDLVVLLGMSRHYHHGDGFILLRGGFSSALLGFRRAI